MQSNWTLPGSTDFEMDGWERNFVRVSSGRFVGQKGLHGIEIAERQSAQGVTGEGIVRGRPGDCGRIATCDIDVRASAGRYWSCRVRGPYLRQGLQIDSSVNHVTFFSEQFGKWFEMKVSTDHNRGSGTGTDKLFRPRVFSNPIGR